LQIYTGFDIPIVACSATMPTSTFNIIWQSLDSGHRHKSMQSRDHTLDSEILLLNSQMD
ncbi:hypothetical protein K439DRAFT_1367517, partial [Ramaria rubella]